MIESKLTARQSGFGPVNSVQDHTFTAIEAYKKKINVKPEYIKGSSGSLLRSLLKLQIVFKGAQIKM